MSISSPNVSIVIPTLNEELHIAKVVGCFQQNTYKHIVEIIVVDGGSEDETCSIVNQLAQSDSRIQLIHNPKRIQSAAINLALEFVKGDLTLRADAHTLYGLDYVEKCVSVHVENPEVINVGGSQRFIYHNVFQGIVAALAHSKIGSGNAKYRNQNYSGFAETVYLGCFKTQKLKEIGGYNAKLPINEDFELNFRIQQRFGTKSIFVDRDIKAYYYPRRTFSTLIIQYFKYGLYKYLTSKNFKTFSLRSLIPVLSSLLMPIILVLLGCIKPTWTILFIGITYLTIVFDSILSAKRNLKISSSKLIWGLFFSPIVLLAQVFSFSFGYLTSWVIYKR